MPGNPSLLQDVFVLMDARIKSGHDDRSWIATYPNKRAAAGSNLLEQPQPLMIETYFLL
jgi:hypothetical protein